jgi:hypothetical protein
MKCAVFQPLAAKKAGDLVARALIAVCDGRHFCQNGGLLL